MTQLADNLTHYVFWDMRPGSESERTRPDGPSIDDIDIHVMPQREIDQGCVGIRASAAVAIRHGTVMQYAGMIHTAGLFGIDDDADYRALIAGEQLDELQVIADALGIPRDHTAAQIEAARARVTQTAYSGI